MVHFYIAVGIDHEFINEVLNFTRGDDQECFTFLPIDDSLSEPTENITIIGSSANPSLQFTPIGNEEATISIIDNGE